MTHLQMRAKLYSRSHKGQDRRAGGLSVVINEKPGGNPQFSLILVQYSGAFEATLRMVGDCLRRVLVAASQEPQKGGIEKC
jgi:hypothetical protein